LSWKPIKKKVLQNLIRSLPDAKQFALTHNVENPNEIITEETQKIVQRETTSGHLQMNTFDNTPSTLLVSDITIQENLVLRKSFLDFLKEVNSFQKIPRYTVQMSRISDELFDSFDKYNVEDINNFFKSHLINFRYMTEEISHQTFRAEEFRKLFSSSENNNSSLNYSNENLKNMLSSLNVSVDEEMRIKKICLFQSFYSRFLRIIQFNITEQNSSAVVLYKSFEENDATIEDETDNVFPELNFLKTIIQEHKENIDKLKRIQTILKEKEELLSYMNQMNEKLDKNAPPHKLTMTQ